MRVLIAVVILAGLGAVLFVAGSEGQKALAQRGGSTPTVVATPSPTPGPQPTPTPPTDLPPLPEGMLFWTFVANSGLANLEQGETTSLTIGSYLAGPVPPAVPDDRGGAGPASVRVRIVGQAPSALQVQAAAGAGWNCTVTPASFQCDRHQPVVDTFTSLPHIDLIFQAATATCTTAEFHFAGFPGTSAGNVYYRIACPGLSVFAASVEPTPGSSTVVARNVTVRNNGKGPTVGPIAVQLAFNFPLTVTGVNGFVCAPPVESTYLTHLVICRRESPALQPGQSVVVAETVTWSVTSCGFHFGQLFVNDASSPNTSFGYINYQVPCPQFEVVIAFSKPKLSAGDPVTVEVSVRNPGTNPIAPAAIQSTLQLDWPGSQGSPATYTFEPGWTCQLGWAPNHIPCTNPGLALAPGATAKVATIAIPPLAACNGFTSTWAAFSLYDSNGVSGSGHVTIPHECASHHPEFFWDTLPNGFSGVLGLRLWVQAGTVPAGTAVADFAWLGANITFVPAAGFNCSTTGPNTYRCTTDHEITYDGSSRELIATITFTTTACPYGVFWTRNPMSPPYLGWSVGTSPGPCPSP